MNFKFSYIIPLFLSLAVAGSAQNIISGVVVDSSSLASLPGVHIKIKNTSRGTTTNATGAFSLKTADFDTLLFSVGGYNVLEYPLLGPEYDMLIRMTEKVRMLKEVKVTAAPPKEIMEKKPPRYVQSDGSYIRTPSLAEGISSPITYFSKAEHEKRKLLRMRAENKKIKTYVEIVNDPDLKIEILKKFTLKEKEYYDLLAKFNQGKTALYLTNPEEIKKLLFSFIKNNIRK